jgi:hypothetical protein
MHTKFYVCTHPEHNGVMEIFPQEDFKEARRVDDRYRILVVTASKGAALEFVQEAIGAALVIDPQLEHLKQDIQELYL